MGRHAIVVGAGFSGTLHAIHLLRGGARVTLIDRATPGRGLAYGAAHPTHLLNVPAGKMSAFPDEPGHFLRWLAQRGLGVDPASFAPRRVYGDYVEDCFAQARTEAGDRLAVIAGTVEDLRLDESAVTARLADGREIAADAATLTLGNLPPHTPGGLDPGALPPGRYVADPWAPDATAGLGREDRVLIIGTGLTMVDIALLLDEAGYAGPILALSRRGLLPRAHAPQPPLEQPRTAVPLPVLSNLVRELRGRARAVGWRHAVDELRPFTQALWRAADADQRGRFLRHARAWWDVHRHRIAPEIDGRLRAMIARGQLQVAAGKLVALAPQHEGVGVTWRPRGADAPVEQTFTRIINCTGPEANLARSREPLLRGLIETGAIRSDPLGVGIDVDAQSRVIGAEGRLYALGPLTRGAFWEINAVPDIRVQAQQVAATLLTDQP